MEMDRNQNRIEALRVREESGVLTNAERAELDAYYQSVEQRESAYLIPAIDRLRQQRAVQEQAIIGLEELHRRKRDYLNQIAALAREIAAIETEESRLLADARGA